MIDYINCPLFQLLRKHKIPSCELDFHHGRNEFSLNYIYGHKRYSFNFNLTKETIAKQWYLVVNQAKFDKFVTNLNITIESLLELEKELMVFFTNYKMASRVNYEYDLRPVYFMINLLDEIKWIANHLVTITSHSIYVEDRRPGDQRHYQNSKMCIEFSFIKNLQINENNHLPIIIQSFLVESNLKVQDLINMGEKIREFSKNGIPNDYVINFMYESKV